MAEKRIGSASDNDPARHTPAVADFDDRLWPVHGALFVLAGLIAGIVVLNSRFDDPRLLYNGWVHLAFDGTCLAALLWGITRARSRLVPRLQFSVALSLLAHLLLLLFLGSQYLEALFYPKQKPPAEVVLQEEIVTLPDYVSPQRDVSPPGWEQPVETTTPDTAQAQIASRASDDPETPAPEPRRVDSPERPDISPEKVEIERPERAAPRRSPRLAGLDRTRRLIEASEQLVEQIPQPEIREPSPREAAPLNPQVANPARRETTAELSNRSLNSAVEPAPRRPEAVELVRRPREESLADASPASPERIRRARQPLRDPTELAEVMDAPITEEPREPTIAAEAAVSAVQRRQPPTPDVERPAGSQAAAQRSTDRPPPRQTSQPAPRRVARSLETTRDNPAAAARLPRAEMTTLRQTAGDAPAPIPRIVAAKENAERGGRAPSDGMTLEPSQGTLARTRSTLPPSRLKSGSSAGTSQLAVGGAETRLAPPDIAPVRGDDESISVTDTSAVRSIERASFTGSQVDARIDAPADSTDPVAASSSEATSNDALYEPAPSGAVRSGASPNVAQLARRPTGDGLRPQQATSGVTSAAGDASPSRPRRFERLPQRQQGRSGGAIARERSLSAGALPAELSQAEEPSGRAAQPTGAVAVSRDARGDASSPQPAVEAPRRRTAGLRVQISAPEGSGGLTADPAPQIGLPTRRARRESQIVRADVDRFVLERSGGRLAVDGRATEGPAQAFVDRDPQTRRDVARSRGGTEASERAVELGLEFLARLQEGDGSWSLHRFGQGRAGFEDPGHGKIEADTAATGLALLAFLGAGYTHQEDKYRQVVNRGLQHLIENQKETGDLFSGGSRVAWLYSHGIAAIVLCEAYGMTRDPRLREPAQRALGFIIDSQHPEQGGWRYRPRWESDTSVSGWQIMALRSGQLAGLAVPQEPYNLASHWLDTAQPSGDPSRYVYLPGFVDRNEGKPSRAMTAEGLLMRLLMNWDRANPHVIRGAEFLLANLPGTDAPDEPLRDAYFWYYGTQVMFEMQGDYWPTWNDRLRDMLVESQQSEGPMAGSWDPSLPVPDRWGQAGGRIYVTAMHLLILEVYYRHLPLYQSLAE